MCASMYLLAGLLFAVDTGWQPLAGGGFEYIIQIEPELMDAIKAGEEFTSDIPPNFRDVRSFRIRYGTGPVPRIGDPTAAASPAGAPTPAEPGSVRPVSAEAPIDDAKPLLKNLTTLRQPGATGFLPNMGALQPPPKDELDAEKPRLAEGTGGEPVTQEAAYGDRADPSQSFKPNTNATAGMDKGFGSPGTGRQPSSKSAANEQSPSDGKAGSSGSSRGGASGARNAAASDEEKPWWPLTLTAFGLFISLAGNAYLGMMAWELRERCLSLLRNKGNYSAGAYGSGSGAPASGGRKYSLSSAAADDEDQDVRAVEDSQSWRSRR